MSQNDPPSNSDLVGLLEPWFPVFGRVGLATQRDQLAAIPILGMPRRTERANDYHRAWRKNLGVICQLADPLLTLVEEPEGQGLDYIVCRMNPELPFILRWGRYNGLTVRRNNTQRTGGVWDQGKLFGVDADDVEGMQTVTLGFTIENDWTVVGLPCWYFGRLVLLRERREASEFITEAFVYEPPADNIGGGYEAPPLLVSKREQEVDEWAKMVRNIRGSA